MAIWPELTYTPRVVDFWTFHLKSTEPQQEQICRAELCLTPSSPEFLAWKVLGVWSCGRVEATASRPAASRRETGRRLEATIAQRHIAQHQQQFREPFKMKIKPLGSNHITIIYPSVRLIRPDRIGSMSEWQLAGRQLPAASHQPPATRRPERPKRIEPTHAQREHLARLALFQTCRPFDLDTQ